MYETFGPFDPGRVDKWNELWNWWLVISAIEFEYKKGVNYKQNLLFESAKMNR